MERPCSGDAVGRVEGDLDFLTAQPSAARHRKIGPMQHATARPLAVRLGAYCNAAPGPQKY